MIPKKTEKEILLTKEQLLEALKDVLIPPSWSKQPPIPDGYPKNFYEALSFSGPCSIPMIRKSKNGVPIEWKWILFINGNLFKDDKTDKNVLFSSFDYAMEAAWEFILEGKEQ